MKKIYLASILFLFASAGVLWAHAGHEHASNLPIHVPWGLKGLGEVSNVHPLFVHFPIALLLTSTAFYFLGSVFRKEELFAAAKWELYFGTLSAAGAVATGLQAANTVSHNEQTHAIMMAHQYLGFTVLGLSLLFSTWVFFSKANIPSKGRRFFLTGLVLLALVLTQGADLGGRMVFLNGVGVGRKSMRSEKQSDVATEKWQAIESHQAHLKMTIESGNLENVHEVAFTIRDLVKTLPETNLSSDQKIVFQSLLKEVEQEANLLDEYGDAGNKIKTQDEFEKFKQTLLSIKNLYGKS